MPTRLLREGIISSERVEQLDPPAEVFYRRLMSKVDDHGLFDARPSILRASLYPLRIDRVREADISRWIAACVKAGLIVLYEAEGKPYLMMLNTGWEKRSKAKYPLPPENGCKQLLTPVPVVVDVVVSEVAGNPLSGKPDAAPPEAKRLNGSRHYADAEGVLEYLNKSTGKGFEFRNRTGDLTTNADRIIQRLKQGYTAEEMREVVHAKCAQWLNDDKMAEYLRPATLFAKENFEQYIGELRGGDGR